VVFQEMLGVNPDSLLARASAFADLAIAITLWFALGHLLKKFEFVRLLGYSDVNRTVRLRFSSEELAERARQVLVLPEEADSNDVFHP
jgi:hypothetical protein